MCLRPVITPDPRSMLIQKASVYLAIDILPINMDQGSVLVDRYSLVYTVIFLQPEVVPL